MVVIIIMSLGLVILVLFVLDVAGTQIIRIPLTYAFDWDMVTKLPI
jgi:hypothetical protein